MREHFLCKLSGLAPPKADDESVFTRSWRTRNHHPPDPGEGELTPPLSLWIAKNRCPFKRRALFFPKHTRLPSPTSRGNFAPFFREKPTPIAQDLTLFRIHARASFSRGNAKHCAHLARPKTRKMQASGGYTPFSGVPVYATVLKQTFF